MSTIREDVVTIGFEVEQNPFADLTSDLNSIDAKLGILEDTESGLKNIEKSAEDATDQMDSLANSIHAPPIDKLVDGVSWVRGWLIRKKVLSLWLIRQSSWQKKSWMLA